MFQLVHAHTSFSCTRSQFKNTVKWASEQASCVCLYIQSDIQLQQLKIIWQLVQMFLKVSTIIRISKTINTLSKQTHFILKMTASNIKVNDRMMTFLNQRMKLHSVFKPISGINYVLLCFIDFMRQVVCGRGQHSHPLVASMYRITLV